MNADGSNFAEEYKNVLYVDNDIIRGVARNLFWEGINNFDQSTLSQ